MASKLAAVPILGRTTEFLFTEVNAPFPVALVYWAYIGIVLSGALQTLNIGNPIFLIPSIPIYYIIVDNCKKRYNLQARIQALINELETKNTERQLQ